MVRGGRSVSKGSSNVGVTDGKRVGGKENGVVVLAEGGELAGNIPAQ
jgi:hypothetical protein